MICRFCGKNVSSDFKFCPNCGNRPDDDKRIRSAQPIPPPEPAITRAPAPIPPPPPYPAPARPYPAQAQPYAAAKIKPGNTIAFWLGKLAVLGALFCFFLPFLHTSVRLITDHSKDYTGTYLLIEAKDEVDSDYVNRRDNEAYEVMSVVAVVLGAALFLEIVALVLPVGTSVFSLLATFDLAFFIFCCKAAEESLRNETYYRGIDVEAGTGVYFSIALLIASIVLMCANSSMKKQKKAELAALGQAGAYYNP